MVLSEAGYPVQAQEKGYTHCLGHVNPFLEASPMNLHEVLIVKKKKCYL